MTLFQDLRFGSRLFLKRPGLTALAVFALALGIGLTTTMFSIVNGAVIRGLPFEESEKLLHLEGTNPSEGISSLEVSIHDFTDWRAQQRSFEDIAAFYVGTVNVSGTEGRPERYNGGFMTANAFGLLHVQPLLGRGFRKGEDHPSAEGVIVLGYKAWRERFNADPTVLGRTVRANGQVVTVVGVMPARFRFPMVQDIWLPLRLDPVALERGAGMTLEVFGRLKPEVSQEQAETEFAGIARRLEVAYPTTNKGVGVVIKPYVQEYLGDEAIPTLYTMLGAVFGVLLIACANVANLLLARTAMRTKEVAIRSALGASRLRVIGQLLAEALLLAAAGGVIGLAIAKIGIDLFNNGIANTNPPFWIDIRIDPVVLTFVMALTIASSLISGIVPAIQASRADVNEILKDESRGASSLRLGKFSKGLVVAEVALSCGLLVAAGLMIKSVVRLKSIDWGFATADVFTARVGLMESDYPDEASQRRFFESLVTRLEGQPGVRSVAVASALPLGSGRTRFSIEGNSYASDRDYPQARHVVVSPRFFETFGLRVFDGRDFTWTDNASALPVALVNQSFALRYFPGESPIGKRIRLGRPSEARPAPEAWRTIVGIVTDTYLSGPNNREPQGIYLPRAQSGGRFMSIAVRAHGQPMALTSRVREAVIALDRNLPIYNVSSMAEVIASGTWFYGVFGTLFMVFGFAALLLAAIGLYGVMAFSVSRRTQEIGVRMALGARGADVLKLVLRQGALELALGVTLGLGLAAGLSRLLTALLFKVEPWDPAIFVSIVAVLATAGLVACIVPARRALNVDPLVALRYE